MSFEGHKNHRNENDVFFFPGITLESKLQWASRITKLSKQLSAVVYAYKNIRTLSDVKSAIGLRLVT